MKFTAIFLVLFLTGCMSMQNLSKSWEGESIDKVTAAWGEASSEVSNDIGGITYTWVSSAPSMYGRRTCKRTLVSDTSGKVIKGTYSGCPYFYFVDNY
jgi:hypothetical protein